MKFNLLQRLRLGTWFNGQRIQEAPLDVNEEPKHYSISEIELMKQHRRDANQDFGTTAKARGYRMHPKIQKRA